MIATRKINNHKAKKNFPTFDLFDKISIKTWGELRKVLFGYGKKYYLRNDFNISVALLIYFPLFILVSIEYFFEVFKINEPALPVILIFEIVIAFYYLAKMLLNGAIINNQFKLHRDLLKKAKDSVFTLLKYK